MSTHGACTFADFPNKGVAAGLRLRFCRIFLVAVAPHRARAPLPEKPARRYALTKIWTDSRHSEGPEPRRTSAIETPQRTNCART